MTEQQPPQEERPDEDEQPIVPMRDLSADEDPRTDPGATGAVADTEPSRPRAAGGVLLVFAALCIVVGLLLPLYRIGAGPQLQGFGFGRAADFTVNAWGLSGDVNSPVSANQLINVIVGNTPVWGIPLVIVALLHAVAGAVALWRPTMRYLPAAALASVALLVGCVAMLAVFLADATAPDRLGTEFDTTLGSGMWLLVFALLLSLGGGVLVLRGRPDLSTPAAPPVDREEPPTPPMGFAAPVVLPELDDT